MECDGEAIVYWMLRWLPLRHASHEADDLTIELRVYGLHHTLVSGIAHAVYRKLHDDAASSISANSLLRVSDAVFQVLHY